MSDMLVRSWWILGMRGVTAMLFGILAITWPRMTLPALTALFAAYALASGAVFLVGAWRNQQRNQGDWWQLLLFGLVGIGTGLVALMHPTLTPLTLLLLIAAHTLVSGFLDLSTAIHLHRVMKNEWQLVLSGATSILFGFLLFLFPAAGALNLVWLIASYVVFTGALLLGFSAGLRREAAKPKARRADRRVNPDRRALAAAEEQARARAQVPAH